MIIGASSFVEVRERRGVCKVGRIHRSVYSTGLAGAVDRRLVFFHLKKRRNVLIDVKRGGDGINEHIAALEV